MQTTINIKTPKHILKTDVFYDFIDKNKIDVDKKLFEKMCKEGCPNYSKKYSCPPCSPEFFNYLKKQDKLFVVMMKIDLNQLNKFSYNEYHKMRIANAVLKPKIDKIFRKLEDKFPSSIMISTGACRLCKPCQLKLKKPCKHPDKRRYSFEALGVDCNKLAKKLFNLELLWYKNKKSPEYTTVICGLAFKNKNKFSSRRTSSSTQSIFYQHLPVFFEEELRCLV